MAVTGADGTGVEVAAAASSAAVKASDMEDILKSRKEGMRRPLRGHGDGAAAAPVSGGNPG